MYIITDSDIIKIFVAGNIDFIFYIRVLTKILGNSQILGILKIIARTFQKKFQNFEQF